MFCAIYAEEKKRFHAAYRFPIFKPIYIEKYRECFLLILYLRLVIHLDVESLEYYDLEYLADTLESYRAPKQSPSSLNLSDYQVNKPQLSASAKLVDGIKKAKSQSRERSPLANISSDDNIPQANQAQNHGQQTLQESSESARMNNIQNVDVLLVEGPYILATQRLRELTDVKIFVDVDADARLSRRGT